MPQVADKPITLTNKQAIRDAEALRARHGFVKRTEAVHLALRQAVERPSVDVSGSPATVQSGNNDNAKPAA